MASRKVNFALAARAAVTALAEAAERIAELDDIFQDSNYYSGASNEIVNADLEGHDITAQDLNNVSMFATNLAEFLNYGTPLQFDYLAAINAFRGM